MSYIDPRIHYKGISALRDYDVAKLREFSTTDHLVVFQAHDESLAVLVPYELYQRMTADVRIVSQQREVSDKLAGVTDEAAAEIMDAFAELACAMNREDESKSITRVVNAVRADTLTIVDDAIRSKFTPALNTGTAMDALVVVGAALRELRTVFSCPPVVADDASGSEKSL